MRSSKTKSRTLTGREARASHRMSSRAKIQQGDTIQIPSTDGSIRLNKFLADAGICSRRHADDLIAKGEVQVNGKKVFELGAKVTSKDRIVVEGKPVQQVNTKVTLVFNKPKGVLTTMSDPHGRPCVADYLDRVQARVFPVGRLDYDSEGLMILTNDGDLAQKIMHPKHEVPKTYMVKVSGHPTAEQLQKLKRGVSIIGGRVSAKEIEKIRGTESDKYDWLKIVITEGKNRQIRKMFEKIGFDVLKLQRVAIGKLKLGSLGRGEYSALMPDEIERIFSFDTALIRPEKRLQPVGAKTGKRESSRKSSTKKVRRPKSAKTIAREMASKRG